ncbi:MAG: hypothetical protein LBS97_04550 [Treponema sp.]|nr:hypothetical protein [Treponema sp.]
MGGENTETGAGPGVKPGFTFNLALYADAFRLDKTTYGHSPQRKTATNQDTQAISLPFSNLDWVGDDSNISMGYQSAWYGGKYTFKKSNITNFGAVQGWVKFGLEDAYLKIIAGNDNDFTYADSLGADPGLRIYTGGTTVKDWQVHENPDNITLGNGIGLSGFYKGITLDLAASEYTATPQKTQTPRAGTVNEYGDTEDLSYQFGGRAGYKAGDFAKVNVSYIVEYDQAASKYGWDTGGSIAATSADAERWIHRGGVFGTVTPIKDLGVTLGYSANVTKYLDEYYSAAGNLETTFPLIWKHGVNINARYNGLLDGKLRVRTDNNLSIYKDKNYSVFDAAGAAWTLNYNYRSDGKNYAEVQHIFLWNGLGAEWDMAKINGRKLMLAFYGRNLLRIDEATSRIIEQQYTFTRDELKLDLQVKYYFSGGTSAFAGLRFQDLITKRSKDLTGQSKEYFVDSMKMPGEAYETTDHQVAFSIPVGINMAW